MGRIRLPEISRNSRKRERPVPEISRSPYKGGGKNGKDFRAGLDPFGVCFGWRGCPDVLILRGGKTRDLAIDFVFRESANMARRRQSLIRGTGTHRRTESDYMGVLLDAVSLEDWREVVAGALRMAKNGDTAARIWLAQYLVGKSESKAPSPLTVVVQQWAGNDPVAAQLAEPVIDREKYPALYESDEWEDGVRAEIAAELEGKLSPLAGGNEAADGRCDASVADS